MKVILTLSIVLLISTFASAQTAQVTNYIEFTAVSSKTGTAVSWRTKDAIEIGLFYQRHSPFATAEDQLPRFYEQEFYGVDFGYPIIHRTHIDLLFTTKVGAQNKQNFLITPGLRGYLKPMPWVSLMVGAGVRGFKPTGIVGIKFSL